MAQFTNKSLNDGYSINTVGNNGRVFFEDTNKEYGLFAETANTSNFNKEAIFSIHESNDLNKTFFSRSNIDNIQGMIRYYVHKQSNHIIGRQSDTQLKIIMRSYYLQYSNNLKYDIDKQVNKLNLMVVNYCVPQIISNIKQHIMYKHDLNHLPTPLERSQNVSIAGTKTLETKTFF